MTTTHITCAYKLRAVGAVPVATLHTRFAAVPVDLALPQTLGLLYESDATGTVGQDVTRTIVFRPIPDVVATATAALFPGNAGGPLDTLTLGAHGQNYATPPIIDLSSGSPQRQARAFAKMGASNGGFVINGGSGYTSPQLSFIGGQLAPDGDQATGTVTQLGGIIQSYSITSPGGPYQVPPMAVVTGGPGSGAILSVGLQVTGLEITDHGSGYLSAPSVVFDPFFAACCPDTHPASQIAFLKNWMVETFQRALKMPILQIDPVIS
jgi:hypothetical protein